jgi:hypothetical protein
MMKKPILMFRESMLDFEPMKKDIVKYKQS